MPRLKPVSQTAYYCAAIRAWDAASASPVCDDRFAQLFLTDDARRIAEPFRSDTFPNRTNAARARIIDDLLRRELAAEPNRRVIGIGAGFDSRPFRLTGGRWLEVDEPALVAVKDAVLPPGSAPNPLHRVPIDFAVESLADTLAPFGGEPCTIVVEGVSMYLSTTQRDDLFAALGRACPEHRVICDLTTPRFIRRYGRGIRRRLAALDARMGDLFEDHRGFLEACGYRILQRISVVRTAAALGAIPIFPFLLDTLFRGLAEGYLIWVAERTATGRAAGG